MPSHSFAPETDGAIPITALRADALEDWLENADASTQSWVSANGFKAAAGQVLLIPSQDGQLDHVLFGLGGPKNRARGRFHFAMARSRLPEGVYRLADGISGDDLDEAALGWLLGGYSFERYAAGSGKSVDLIAPDGIDAGRIEAIAAGEMLTRDLINTPASDMGPEELEAAATDLAQTHKAEIAVIRDDDLLSGNFPMIHTVGRASNRRPRLIDMHWGSSGPRVTLVGKGVCFDTGGLNIKPGASMGLMKKDMGGAAAVLGLAHMIMATGLPIRLRVLIPAVENAIDGSAFRPGDILTSRKGLTVEINNTDAEGRLVLADALALADEEDTDLIVSMATLTGAARVAVGPDLAPYYTDDDDLARHLETGGKLVRDPVWRMPFWTPYEPMIEPGIADLDNAPKGGFAGSITAALFLRRFVDQAPRYLHFDIYGWQPSAAPGRPKGGVGQGTRAVLDALPRMFDL